MSLTFSQLVTLRKAWSSWNSISIFKKVFHEWAKYALIVSDASGSTDDSNLHYFVEGTFQDDSESTDDSGSTDDIPRVDVGSLWDLYLVDMHGTVLRHHAPDLPQILYDYMHENPLRVDLGQYHAPHVHLARHLDL